MLQATLNGNDKDVVRIRVKVRAKSRCISVWFMCVAVLLMAIAPLMRHTVPLQRCAAMLKFAMAYTTTKGCQNQRAHSKVHKSTLHKSHDRNHVVL